MTNKQHYNNALPAGYILDNFEIINVLGSGSFGIAYLAKDTYLDEKCVVKEYMPNEFAYRESSLGTVKPKGESNTGNYEWGLKEFLNEAKTLKKCKHHHIVEVIRFFEANSTAYIVMPYVKGQSLSQLLQNNSNKRLPEETLKAIIIPLLEGLKTVHAKNIFHRDIKLSNIYIYDEDKTPILIDFGAARFSLGSHSHSLTTILTPGYSPHEQYYRHGKQGAWTDIYSMGAVMYCLISGKKPIEAPARVSNDPLIPAIEIGKGRYSKHLLAAIDHALAFKESDRPQTVEQWLLEINQTNIPNENNKKNAAEKKPSIGKRYRSFIIAVIALLIISILILSTIDINQNIPSSTDTITTINSPKIETEITIKPPQLKVQEEIISPPPEINNITQTKQSNQTKTENISEDTELSSFLEDRMKAIKEERNRIKKDQHNALKTIANYYSSIEKKDVNYFMSLWKDKQSIAAKRAEKHFKEGSGACQLLSGSSFDEYSDSHAVVAISVACQERRREKTYEMNFDLEKVASSWKIIKLYSAKK